MLGAEGWGSVKWKGYLMWRLSRVSDKQVVHFRAAILGRSKLIAQSAFRDLFDPSHRPFSISYDVRPIRRLAHSSTQEVESHNLLAERAEPEHNPNLHYFANQGHQASMPVMKTHSPYLAVTSLFR